MAEYVVASVIRIPPSIQFIWLAIRTLDSKETKAENYIKTTPTKTASRFIKNKLLDIYTHTKTPKLTSHFQMPRFL